MFVMRESKYIEVFEINMAVYDTIRGDEDFCERLVVVSDPVLVQQMKCGNETARKGIHLKSRIYRGSKNITCSVPEKYLIDTNQIPKACVDE